MNLKLCELMKMTHRQRLMVVGADDSYKLFWVMSGIGYMLNEKDGRVYGSFMEYIYRKYGRIGSRGWYESLDKFTGDPRKSVLLFFEEMEEYMKTAQQVDSAEASTIAVPPSDPSGSPR